MYIHILNCNRVCLKVIPLGILFTIGLIFFKRSLQEDSAEEVDNPVDTKITDPVFDNYRVRCCSWEAQQAKLPNLTKLKWPSEHYASSPAGTTFWRPPAPFEPVLSEKQRNLFRRLLHIFSKIMFDNGMGDQFMIYGGTLLGSYRHHDFIPWDDDIDVIVNFSVRDRVRKLLWKLSPEFELTPSGKIDKFHARLISPLQMEDDVELSRPVKQWGWPFIDIFYFQTDDTSMIEYNNGDQPDTFIPRSYIFPLYFRPFGKEWYPAPRDPLGYILYAYGSLRLCVKPAFSHVDETFGEGGSKPCQELSSRYAFVQHSGTDLTQVDGSGMQRSYESLVIESSWGSKMTIHTIPVVVANNYL